MLPVLFSTGLQSSTSSLPNISVDGCRVAPYVALPSMRLSLESAIKASSTTSTQGGSYSPPSSIPAASHPRPAALDPTLAAALTAAAGLQPFLGAGSPLMAAAAAAAANSMLLYGPTPTAMQYGLSLQAALQAPSGESLCKNNSIAELRMKAKKYAAALGL